MDDATKEAIAGVEGAVARVAMLFRRDRGPVNLQALWMRAAESALYAGRDARDATREADSIVEAFKERARKLAEDSVALPYLGSVDDEQGAP